MRLKFRIFCDLALKFICEILTRKNILYILVALFLHCIVPLLKCLGSIMALLKYFSVKSKSLPDLNGLLSSTVKSQTIESANRKVSALLTS